MPIESADDRATFIADFGVPVTWAGAVETFLGIFERPSSTAGEAEFAAPATARVASLLVLESSLPPDAAEDDGVSIEGEEGAYACARILPDGTGFCVVELKAVT